MSENTGDGPEPENLGEADYVIDLPLLPSLPLGPGPQPGPAPQREEPATGDGGVPGDQEEPAARESVPDEPGTSVPDLEAILRASQGITPDMASGISTLASVHAQWRQAWADTGRFTDEEAFELTRILVAASAGGVRSLGLRP